jgi:hypothetical protein
MSKLIRILGAAISLIIASPLSGQSLSAYLPSSSAASASKLLASIDKASAAIEEMRAAERRDQLKAEAESLEAYALLTASRGDQSLWAKSDGAATSGKASESYLAARAKARELAKLLSSGSEGEAKLASGRDASAAALAKSIIASGIGQKQASSLAGLLSTKSKAARLFPEAAEVSDILRKSGAKGAREAAAAFAYRDAPSAARAFLKARARILAIEANAEAPLSRLERALGAYEAFSSASSLLSYPGDLAEMSDTDRALVSMGIAAMAAIGSERASALVEALSSGDGRDAAAAAAARRLAGLWLASSQSGRRELSALCASSEGRLALFASALAPPGTAKPHAARHEVLEMMASLGELSAVIADEEASSRNARGRESALILLQKPELARAARGEARYANLYAEASRRIEAVYAQADQGAAARLESSSALVSAARAALGSSPVNLVVRPVTLEPRSADEGRRLAFVAIAADASGASVSIPIGAAIAGEAYAIAFARSGGLDMTKVQISSLLREYGQQVATAYAPESSGDCLVVDLMPKGDSSDILDAIDLELALIGGWRP